MTFRHYSAEVVHGIAVEDQRSVFRRVLKEELNTQPKFYYFYAT